MVLHFTARVPAQSEYQGHGNAGVWDQGWPAPEWRQHHALTSPAAMLFAPLVSGRVAQAGTEQRASKPPPFPPFAALWLPPERDGWQQDPLTMLCCKHGTRSDKMMPGFYSFHLTIYPSPTLITPFKCTACPASPVPRPTSPEQKPRPRSLPAKSPGAEKRGRRVQKQHQTYRAVKMSSATVQEGTGVYNIIYTVHTERKNILFTVKCFIC